MATWSEVQAHVRGKYRLQTDAPQHFILAWQVDDNRPQNFDGELHVATQDIHCQPLSAGDRDFIVTARNDAPAIAAALVEAVDLLKRLTDRPGAGQADHCIRDARAWLAKHVEKA